MEKLITTEVQFDLLAGIALKKAGMEAAQFSYGSQEWLLEARKVAEILAAKYGETNSDAVLRICPKPLGVSPNAIGSLFKGKQWVCVGRMQTSKVSGHGREIRRWALK